jgi:hypothetical protein
MDSLLAATEGRRIVQKLEVYQSLWGMQLRNPNTPERTDEEAFAMVAEAGFDGSFRIRQVTWSHCWTSRMT